AVAPDAITPSASFPCKVTPLTESLPRDQMHWLANRTTIIGRTHVPMLDEYPCENLVRRVPHLLRDLRDRMVCLLKKLAGLFDPQARQVDPWRYTDALLEHACEMKGRQS